MIPPTSIDGTDITGATIDGQDVQEITVDGQTVFAAGPDLVQPDLVHLTFDNADLTNTAGTASFSVTSGSESYTFDNDTGSQVFDTQNQFSANTTDLTNQIGGSNDFTWVFWYKRFSLSGADRLFGNGTQDGNNIGGIIFYDWSSGSLANNPYWGGDRSSRGEFNPASNFNTWNHLALTYDASSNNATGYTNGNVDFTTNISIGSLDGDGLGVSACGSRDDSSNDDFNGLIEDVRVYSFELTSQEITDIFNNTGPNS